MSLSELLLSNVQSPYSRNVTKCLLSPLALSDLPRLCKFTSSRDPDALQNLLLSPFIVPAANCITVTFFPWHTKFPDFGSQPGAKKSRIWLCSCRQVKTARFLTSSAARLQGFCCCKGNVSHAVPIHHFSSAARWISVLRCKQSDEGPGYNFLYDFSSECGDWLNVISIIEADFLSSPPTAETLSVVAKISGRAWHKPKLSFQLIPEDQINSNLCLNTVNTSHGQQPSSTPPVSRKALRVISLKGRWGQSAYGTSTQYQVYCDCATAGNAAEPLVYFKTHYKPQNRHNFIFFFTGSEQWIMGISVAYTDWNHKDMHQNC